MSTINIYSVANHLEENGWRLLSTEYKNLKTELEMECPKGHKQTFTYEQWRKHPICEVCQGGDTTRVKKRDVPPKPLDAQRVLALDAATNITGWAVYDNGTLVSYGTVKMDRNDSTEKRINDMKKWLARVLVEWEVDFAGIEGIQLQQYGKGNFQVELYRTLAQLQGVLIDTLFEACVDYDLAYAVEWRKYCGVGEGIGRENKKKQAQDKVKTWYNIDCTQDEADAICIGKYFCHLLKNSKSTWGEDIE